jgi:hypothetical protein
LTLYTWKGKSASELGEGRGESDQRGRELT